MLMMTEELDLDDAERRREEAAERAKRLEEHCDGWAALAAWKEHELIGAAIEGQRRSRRATERARANGVAPGR